jgi:TolA-binding protein
MKKLIMFSTVAMFSVAIAQAQTKNERTAAPAKVESKESLKAVEKGQAAPVDTKTQIAQLDQSISDLEKFIIENSTREGFEKEAYDNRLNILRNRRAELSSNPDNN